MAQSHYQSWCQIRLPKKKQGIAETYFSSSSYVHTATAYVTLTKPTIRVITAYDT